MKRQNVRVLLASERPETRTFLRRIVESEEKAVIVAEAENGTRALNLARSMRPDVAVIDSYLPYLAGIDNIPISRIAGLDIAQSISEEIPNMQVVLLNTLREGTETNALLCRETKQTCIPFTITELGELDKSAGNLIFANVTPKVEAVPVGKISLSDKALFAGILGIILGWLMVLTMFLATAGLYVLLAGVTATFFSLLAKVSKRVFK